MGAGKAAPLEFTGRIRGSNGVGAKVTAPPRPKPLPGIGPRLAKRMVWPAGSWFVIICRSVYGLSSASGPGNNARTSASMSGRVETRPPPPESRGNGRR